MPNIQTYNDKWVINILNEKRRGFYVEAGAVDGKRGSDTDILHEKYSWTGILIEPNKRMFKNLIKLRPNDITLNCALSNKDKSYASFYDYPPPHGGWSRLESEVKLLEFDNNFPIDPLKDATVYTIKLRTLNSILKEYNAPKLIDFLDLDIEGHLHKTLEGLDLDKYKFRCISTEGDANILLSNGYKQVENPFCKDCDTRFETFFYINKNLL